MREIIHETDRKDTIKSYCEKETEVERIIWIEQTPMYFCLECGKRLAMK